MNEVKTRLALCLVAATALAGCSSDHVPRKNEANSSHPVPEVAYPHDVFGEAAWGSDGPSVDDPFLASNSTFVYLNEEGLHGINAVGEPSWDVDVKRTAGDEYANGQPELRLLDDKTVAVIEEGEKPGEGLEESKFITQVTVVDIQIGKIVGQQEVDGEGDLSEFGVAFPTAGDDAGRPMLTAAAKMKSVPDSKIDLLGGKVNKTLLGSAGNTPIFKLVGAAVKSRSILDGSKPEAESKLQSGFAGSDWNSVEANPKAGSRPRASVAAADTHYVVGTWVSSDSTGTKKTAGIIDAENGKLLGRAKCGTIGGGRPLVASPNGNYRVFENLWFDANGATQCYGGGSGQKSVTLTAVTDDGTAIGVASEEAGGERLLVTVTPGNEPETHRMPEDANPPTVIMDGNLGLFRDDETGAITGNPIK